MPYVYNNGRYVEEPSTSHAEELDESQFVDEEVKAASEVSAAVMIALSVLLCVGLCTINPVLIASAFGPVAAYGSVFYVHSCNFDARRGNPLAGAYVFSAFYIFVGIGFFLYFVMDCFQKSPSMSPMFSIPLALVCLPFIAYQFYCVGLFYKDGQDHYHLWKARNCHNRYCTHAPGTGLQQQWPIWKSQSRNFEPQGRSWASSRKDRTTYNQVNAVKIVENPMETYQNCNICMHGTNPTHNANGTTTKSSDMDPEKGNCLECPD
ncbi:hypothetical protein DdX_13716 [Ditylenchus destructor]|uniref:Transmembrane protein n=1 Tax=Ditylenchus destructor TaxID=166010 RepID=A0AAD4MVY3_9BILA|nr:hypothetical protein DdX_13716 [Ditylenchus destructor]